MRIIDIPECKDRKELLLMDQSCLVFEAVLRMKEKNVGSVIATKDGKLSGIFTERDLLTKVVSEKLDLTDLRLLDVMTKDVETAYFEDEVYESIQRMINGFFRHLPVVDDDNRLVGMVSQRDFIAISWSQIFEQLKNKTKSSFFSFSAVWMLCLGMFVYSVLILFIYSWLTN